MYDIELHKGVYEYADRSNPIVAKVDMPTFRRIPAEDKPTLPVEVAS